LRYSYYPQDLARCYRNLGYYYIEENKLDIAAALFKYSMNFELSIMAYNELHYIESKGQSINLSKEEVDELIESTNIQIGVNPFIITTLYELAEEYEQNKLYNQSLYFYELLNSITDDETVVQKIKKITNEINY
ncbi:MAG: hypothetical protein IJI42_01090, partial [Methanobrevibacter sp.]|nr:hypothetical protein [Methanobrevibacter sp.]